jgi:hypothetical protein
MREIVEPDRQDGGDDENLDDVGAACHRYPKAAAQRAGKAGSVLMNLSLSRSAFSVDVQRAKFGDVL